MFASLAEEVIGRCRALSAHSEMTDAITRTCLSAPMRLVNVLHAAAHSLAGIDHNAWDSIFGRIAYWHRQG